MPTIEEFQKELRKIERSAEKVQKRLEDAENLQELLEEEINLFEQKTKDYPTQQIYDEVADAHKGMAVAELRRQFESAAAKTGGDINESMLSNLLIQTSSIIPTIEVGKRGGIEINLVEDCERYLGDVGLWFNYVELARQAGEFGTSPHPSIRMNFWRAIFDTGVGAKSYEEVAGMYENTVALRMSFVSNDAPYWYFLEFGNEEFDRGALYPYPSYGRLNAVTNAETKVRRSLDRAINEVESTKSDYLDSLQEIRIILDNVEVLIDELINLKYEDEVEVDEVLAGLTEQAIKYDSIENFEEIDQEAMERIFTKFLKKIENADQYAELRVYDPALPGGRMRIKRLAQTLGFTDIGVD